MRIGDLKYRIEIWGNSKALNELGELQPTAGKLTTVWCSIRPVTNTNATTQANTTYEKTNYKFRIRRCAFDALEFDHWVIFQGERYNIKDITPDFKNKQFVEILACAAVE